MKLPRYSVVVINVGLLLVAIGCSTSPTPNIDATVEVWAAEERPIDATVEARAKELIASQPTATPVVVVKEVALAAPYPTATTIIVSTPTLESEADPSTDDTSVPQPKATTEASGRTTELISQGGDISPGNTEANGIATEEQRPDKGTNDEIMLIQSAIHNIVLGRPTGTSIAVSVLAAAEDQAKVVYSTLLSSDHTQLIGAITSRVIRSATGEPIVIDLADLTPDTKYYYRVIYESSASGVTPGNLHSFRTQRLVGSTFSFGVQGDTHPERSKDKMFNPELMALTMKEVRDRQPDLYFTLGDDFSIEKIIERFKKTNYPENHVFRRTVEGAISYTDYQATIIAPFVRSEIVDGEGLKGGWASYRELREKYFGIMSNATSMFLVNGNHEQAHAANLGGVFSNAAVWAADGRLKYYPLPAPNGFYSGNATPLETTNGYPNIAASDKLLRDYYAFTWGDALFVTIDPYWHSPEVSPNSTLYDGDPRTHWTATMGDAQYQWLTSTLEGSDAKWKFVFAHHINGGGRGAAAMVGNQEWGANLAEFQANRPSWDKPVHQLLVDTGVTVFFQGHDHIFSREVVDGMVYQAVPNPGDNSYYAFNCDSYAPESIRWQGPRGYGVYDPDYSVVLPNTGFLHVTVSPDHVQVEYVRTYREVDLQVNANGSFDGTEVNGEVAFSYSLPARPGDNLARNPQYTCVGSKPPEGWVYNP